jgi:hypothetical protein
MPRWDLPDARWAGCDVFIIGGGPSLERFDWNLLKGELCIGANDAYKLGVSLCQICHFGDIKWFHAHKKELKKYSDAGGVVTTSCPNLQRKTPHWVWTLMRRANGFHIDALGWNGNTGAEAINVALILGAKRVFLLGFDMRLSDTGEMNWHPNNLDKPNTHIYERFLHQMRNLDDHLAKKFPGQFIFNVTKDSSLNVFPKLDLDVFFMERKKL